MISALVAMEDFQEILSSISSLSSSSSLPNTDPLSIDGETWLMAEERTEEILCIIQPTVVSEKARKEVIDYIQRLIQGHYVTEVRIPLAPFLLNFICSFLSFLFSFFFVGWGGKRNHTELRLLS